MINVEKNEGKTIITLDNGHVAALEKIIKDYHLKGDKEAVGFILSIISQADGKGINNGKGTYLPSEELKESSNA